MRACKMIFGIELSGMVFGEKNLHPVTWVKYFFQ